MSAPAGGLVTHRGSHGTTLLRCKARARQQLAHQGPNPPITPPRAGVISARVSPVTDHTADTA